MRLLTGLLAFNLGSNIALILLALWKGNNIVMIHFYALGAYTLIALLFSYWLDAGPARYVRLSIPLFLFIYFALLITGLEDLGRPNALTLTIMSILIALIALYTFVSSALEPAAIPFHRDARYWVSLGVFIYYSGNVFFFSGLSVIITTKIWHIHDTLAVIGNLLYIGAYLCLRKSPIYGSSPAPS